jgi:hypothetical protein
MNARTRPPANVSSCPPAGLCGRPLYPPMCATVKMNGASFAATRTRTWIAFDPEAPQDPMPEPPQRPTGIQPKQRDVCFREVKRMLLGLPLTSGLDQSGRKARLRSFRTPPIALRAITDRQLWASRAWLPVRCSNLTRCSTITQSFATLTVIVRDRPHFMRWPPRKNNGRARDHGI